VVTFEKMTKPEAVSTLALDPWPKGRFRATTLALLQQLQRAFPVEVRWTLVADRGFPSAALFATFPRI